MDRLLNTFIAFYGTQQFLFRVHNSEPMDRVLRHKNPLHNFTCYSLVLMIQVYYNSLNMQVSQVISYIHLFQSKFCTHAFAISPILLEFHLYHIPFFERHLMIAYEAIQQYDIYPIRLALLLPNTVVTICPQTLDLLSGKEP